MKGLDRIMKKLILGRNGRRLLAFMAAMLMLTTSFYMYGSSEGNVDDPFAEEESYGDSFEENDDSPVEYDEDDEDEPDNPEDPNENNGPEDITDETDDTDDTQNPDENVVEDPDEEPPVEDPIVEEPPAKLEPAVYITAEDIAFALNAETYDILEGVSAADENGSPVEVTVVDDGGFSISALGQYTVTYKATHPEDENVTATAQRTVAVILPITPMAESATVTTYAALVTAIGNASLDTIVIGADITVTTALAINRSITFKSDVLGTKRTLNTAATYNLRTMNVTGGDITLTFEDIVISGKTTGNMSGGITSTANSLTLENPVIKNCGYAGYAAGIYYNKSGGNLIINGGEISGNITGYIGGIQLVTGNLIANNVKISGNDGTGIYAENGSVTVNGGEISNNTNGGIYAHHVNLTVSGAIISGNTKADGSDGGGMRVIGNSEVVINGGTVISENTAGNGRYGGGIIGFSGSTINISEDVVISGNTSYYGGGIASYGTVNISGGGISGNSSQFGAGIFAFSSAKITIDGVIISGNTTTYTGNGGGIYGSSGAEITISGGTVISGNTATYQGGGIFSGGAKITISDGTVISGNTAPNGGGIYIPVANYGNLKISSDVTLSDNRANTARTLIDTGYQDIHDEQIKIPHYSFTDGFKYAYNNFDIFYDGGLAVQLRTVAFNTNDGSTVASYSVADGAKLIEPTSTKAGSALEGWYKDSGLTQKWDFATDTVTANITLYAKWGTPRTVKFYSVDTVNPVATKTVADGNTVTPPTVSNPGYSFDGWYTEATFTNKWNPGTPVTTDMELYANWVQAYTVTLHHNGGTGAASITDVVSGATISQPASSYTGHTIEGWYKDSGLTQKWYFDTDIVTGDLDLYAKWDKNQLTVEFYDVDGLKKTVPVDYGDTVAEPTDITRPGRTILGWYVGSLSGGQWTFDTDTVTNNLKLYVKWDVPVYKVEFYDRGTLAHTGYIDEGDIAAEPGGLTNSGHVIEGWYTEDGFVNKWELSDPVTSDMELHANWVKEKHKVEYYSEGALKKTEQVDYNDTATPPDDLDIEGYVIEGWYVGSLSGDKWDFEDPVTDDLELYANWQKQKLTVEFHNGANSWTENVDYGDPVGEPAGVVRPGYNLLGWYTDDQYDDETLWDFDKPVKDNIKLYAKWDPPIYTVSFHDGDTILREVEVAYTDPVNDPNDIKVARPTDIESKTGHTFDGWYVDTGFNTAWDFDDTVGSNLHLYSKWKKDEYTVEFYSGGDLVDTQPVEYGDTVTAPDLTGTVYEIEGRYVEGWYTEPELVNKHSLNAPVTGHLTLHANWVKKIFTVQYYDDTDSKGFDHVNYGDKVTPPALTKTGHTIDGWYTDSGFTGEWDLDDPVTENLVLYVKWKADVYTVEFHDEEKTPSLQKTEQVTYGNTATAPDLTKTGYELEGWYTESGFVNKWNPNSTVTGNLTLYANWEKEKYTVEFYDGTDIVNSQEIEYGEKATDPGASKDGHSFLGWYTDAGFNTAWDPDAAVSANLTIYAKWEIDVYTVNFYDGMTLKKTVQVAYGNPVAEPDDILRAGHNLLGWYTDDQYNIQWDFNDPVTSNLDLYAMWDPPVHTVSFYDGINLVETVEVAHDDTVAAPDGMTKTGYVVEGWYVDESFSQAWDFNDLITGSIDLYAKWVKQKLTVEFHDGANPPKTVVVDYGDPVAEPNDITRPGHNLLGWYTDDQYVNKWNFSDSVTGDLKLYAEWNPPVYTVSFHDDDVGKTVLKIVEVVYPGTTTVDEPNDITRTGYIPPVWYTDPGYNNEWFFSNTVDTNLHLYAKWKKEEYTVKFYDDSDHLDTQAIEYYDTVNAPTPIRTGYRIEGWYTDSNLTSKQSLNAPVTSDLVLYVNWEKEKYTVRYFDGTDIKKTEVVEYEDKTAAPILTKTGHTFDGWYTDSSFSIGWIFTNPVASNLNLYIKWNKEIYTVEYYDGIDLKKTEQVEYGNTATAPSDMTKQGYTLEGWYTESGVINKWNFSTAITADSKLYAKWILNSDSESGSSAGSGSGSGTGTNIDTDTGTGSGPGSGTDSGSGSDSDSGFDSNSNSDATFYLDDRYGYRPVNIQLEADAGDFGGDAFIMSPTVPSNGYFGDSGYESDIGSVNDNNGNNNKNLFLPNHTDLLNKSDSCLIHWLMMLGILITAVYTTARLCQESFKENEGEGEINIERLVGLNENA